MRSRAVCCLVVALLACAALNAANLRLGPETPLSNRIDIQPAALNQSIESVASNGRDFLAIARSHEVLQLVRIGTDGRPVNAFGKQIPYYGKGRIASSGDDYLAVWSTGSGIGQCPMYAQRVDENGEPLEPVRRLDPPNGSCVPAHVASNGSSHLLLAKTGLGTHVESAYLLDGSSDLRHVGNFEGVFYAGVRNGQYVVADGSGFHFISESGARHDPRFPSSLGTLTGLGAAGPDRLLLANRYPGSFAIVNFDGFFIHPETALPCAPADVGWDGVQFVVACPRVGGLFAMRISADGTLRDAQPFLISATGDSSNVQMASNGSTQLLLFADRAWSGGRYEYDLLARAVSGFDALLVQEEAKLVSYSGAAQVDVQLARAQGHTLAVWRNDRALKIEGAFDGRSLSFAAITEEMLRVTPPTVAAGKNGFLVVWGEGYFPGRLLARRVDFSGAILDAVPIVISDRFEVSEHSHGVVYDGEAFMLAFFDDDIRMIRVRRLREDGSISDADVANGGGEVHPVLAQNRVLVPSAWVWLHSSPFVYPELEVMVPPVPRSVFRANATEWSVAAGADRLTFTSFFCTSLLYCGTPGIVQSSFDGDAITPPRVEDPPISATATTIDIVWDGHEYFLAWSERSPTLATRRIRAIRLNADGRPIDAAPFDIAENGATVHKPSLFLIRGGVAIAYSRYDEANGGAPRAFVRTLEPAPTRRWSVRH